MSSTGQAILQAVRQAGGDIWSDDGQLRFRAPQSLVPEIKASKDELLALLLPEVSEPATEPVQGSPIIIEIQKTPQETFAETAGTAETPPAGAEC